MPRSIQQGSWKFIDTFDDGAGADQQATNLVMTMEEFAAVTDSDGTFALGGLNAGDLAFSFRMAGLPRSTCLTCTRLPPPVASQLLRALVLTITNWPSR